VTAGDLDLSEDERRIRDAALDFARKNKKQRCAELTDPKVYAPDQHPVSVFMAGSPGAGKTETSKVLIAELEAKQPGSKILRIDADDLRCEFPSYNGRNSWLYQGAVSGWVSRLLDLAHDQRQSFLLDGTLSNHERARKNVRRCLDHERTVQVLYVYQDPILAWKFVQAREALEGRNIPPQRFIEQYFAARQVVNALKKEFGANIKVDLLFKPNDNTEKLYRAGIDQIDYHVPETYDPDTLSKMLDPRS
jgi:adenylylsulfate kinase-like enzyme